MDTAASPLPAEPAAPTTPLPPDAWPQKAIDACAPEGGFAPGVVTIDIRTNRVWA